MAPKISPLAIQSRESLEEELPSTSGDARGYHLSQDTRAVFYDRLSLRPEE